MAVSAILVHLGPLPALAWRVDIQGGSAITFSGDMSGEFGLLPTLAKGSDMLVAHNAIPEDAQGIPRFLHMLTSVIGNIAAASSIDTLVLPHFMLRSLPAQAQTRGIIAKLFDGTMIFFQRP